LQAKVRELRSTFDAANLRPRLAEIEKQRPTQPLVESAKISAGHAREEASGGHARDRGRAHPAYEDISAYFDLAREGESVEPDLRREIDLLRELVDRLETETLLLVTTMRATPS